MKYLLAVIKETLRMFPTVPMVSREVTRHHPSTGVCPRFNEEDTFGMAINLFGLHYNPRGWSRPHEFLPERWLDASIDGGMDPGQRVYCPFAMGKRSCLGRQFAYIEMLTVISMILQRFRVYPIDEAPPRIVEGGTLVIDDDLHLAFEPLDDGGLTDGIPKTKSQLEVMQLPTFTMAQVREHHTINDLWMVIRGKVYDFTAFVTGEVAGGHPGGAEILAAFAGSDATSDFEFVSHSAFAQRLLKRFIVGTLAEAQDKADPTSGVLRRPSVFQERTGTPASAGQVRRAPNVEREDWNSYL